MSDVQKQIELLDARGDEAELLGHLACDPDTRTRNKRLADDLRDLAQRLRGEAFEQAA